MFILCEHSGIPTNASTLETGLVLVTVGDVYLQAGTIELTVTGTTPASQDTMFNPQMGGVDSVQFSIAGGTVSLPSQPYATNPNFGTAGQWPLTSQFVLLRKLTPDLEWPNPPT